MPMFTTNQWSFILGIAALAVFGLMFLSYYTLRKGGKIKAGPVELDTNEETPGAVKSEAPAQTPPADAPQK